MLDSLFGLFSHDLGMDLGDEYTHVFVRGQGVVLCEPSVAAVHKETKQILGVCAQTKGILENEPDSVVLLRPWEGGAMTNFEIVKAMIKYMIREVHGRKTFLMARLAIAIPSGITEVEKNAVRNAGLSAGSREVYLVAAPMAAAIGLGLTIHEPSGKLIVVISSGVSQIAVISMFGIVCSQSVQVAGNKMKEAIIHSIKKRFRLLIGYRTAQDLIMQIGLASSKEKRESVEIKGKDLATDTYKTLSIPKEEIRRALAEPVAAIIETVKAVLQKTPPELAADIVEKGVVLVGGVSLVPGLARHFQEETGLPTTIGEDPANAVVKGTGMVFEEGHLLERVKI